MTAVKTSLAWQGFRNSNLAATNASTKAHSNGHADDSDGADEGGFVGAESSGSQEMMMEIMDKYVHAGEALAEKENDVRQLMKQVAQLKTVNGELERQTEQLGKSNEKLADDEGRWYSLARELESQMDIIKKGETYTLFQDKVDEVEARLEVSTESYKKCNKRLLDLYSLLSENFTEAGEDEVDEHRQHANLLGQLQDLKSSAMDVQSTLEKCRSERDAAELQAQQAQRREEEVRQTLELQLAELQRKADARDAVARSSQDELRKLAVEHAKDLRHEQETANRLSEACAVAEAAAKSADRSRMDAVNETREATARRERAEFDLQLAEESSTTLRASLAEMNVKLENSQEEAQRSREAHERLAQKVSAASIALEKCREELSEAREAQILANSNNQETSEQIAELETLVQETQTRNSQLDDELQASYEELAALTHAAESLRAEVDAATARAADAEAGKAVQQADLDESAQRMAAAEARASAQEMALLQSAERVAEVERELHSLALQLQEGSLASEHADQQAKEAEKEAKDSKARANSLLEDLERASVDRTCAENRAEQSDEACKQAEASIIEAQTARAAAEDAVEALRHALAAKDADIEKLGKTAEDIDGARATAQAATAAAVQSLLDAQKDARRALEGKSATEQALEASRQQLGQLREYVHGLEAQVVEATRSAQDQEALINDQRSALQDASERSEELKRTLRATQEELQEQRGALASLAEAAPTASTGASAGDTPLSTAHPGMQTHSTEQSRTEVSDAHVVFGTPPPPTHVSNGMMGTSSPPNGFMASLTPVHPANGAAIKSEADQLQAHAEAMELELRYTLESFEGQLSAMAREKVALQKQVKELTGQGSTIRKQVLHYKKLAKESETQVEQMLELQQQLSDAEAANESSRIRNEELMSKVEALEVAAGQAAAWRQSQDELMQLRIRVAEAETVGSSMSMELASKTEELVSTRAQEAALISRFEETETQLRKIKDSRAAVSEELRSTLVVVEELKHDVARVPELEAALAALAEEKNRSVTSISDEAQQAQAKVGELGIVVRSLQQDRAQALEDAQRADQDRAIVIEYLHSMASSLGCSRQGGDPSLAEEAVEKIGLLTTRVSTAEDIMEDIIQLLKRTALEEDVKLETGSSWAIAGIIKLQQRLQLAELKLSQCVEAQESVVDTTAVLEDLSVVLECDSDRVSHKVHELKKLAHELFELRDGHLKEIEQLKGRLQEAARSAASNEAAIARGMSDMFPSDEVTSAREETARLKVAMDAVKQELLDTQQMRRKDAEKHRREQARLEERQVVLTRYVEEHAKGNAMTLEGMHDSKARSRHKSMSLQADLSSTANRLAEQGHNRSGTFAAGSRRRSQSMVDESEFTGSQDGVQHVSPFEAHELAAKVQAILGCNADQVVVTLNEQLAKADQHQLLSRLLGHLKHSYINSMESLASAISHEAVSKASPLLAHASELCAKGTCLASNEEGLAALDEVTSILADLAHKSVATKAEVELRQAKEAVATLSDTLRKERLMMMAFRRWGHFYLALSNEALRKRTKERNQARGQRHTPDKISPSSGGPRSRSSERLQLSSREIQAMVEEEVETISRELARDPSSALLELTDARKEMDEIAMRAQTTLASVFSKPYQAKAIDSGSVVDSAEALEIYTPEHTASVQITSFPTVADPSPIMEQGPDFGASDIIRDEQPPVTSSAALPQPRSAVVSMVEPNEGVQAPTTWHTATDSTYGPPHEDQEDFSSPTVHMQQEPPVSAHTPPPRPSEADTEVNAAATDSSMQSVKDAATADMDSALSTPPPTSTTTAPPMMPPTGVGQARNAGSRRGAEMQARTMGPLVEHGISKAERAEFLRKQREERKANRKKGMQSNVPRTSAIEPALDSVGLRNRRTSAPPSMSAMVKAAAPITEPAPDMTSQPAIDHPESRPPALVPPEDERTSENRQPSLPGPIVDGRQNESVSSKVRSDSPSSQDVAPPPPPAVPVGPPPRMFNPTSVPPPTAGPPTAVPSAPAQPPRHPSIAFSVNDTVEKALKIAEGQKEIAERRASFWKHRFRDMAVWAASFVILAYASDHGLESC